MRTSQEHGIQKDGDKAYRLAFALVGISFVIAAGALVLTAGSLLVLDLLVGAIRWAIGG